MQKNASINFPRAALLLLNILAKKKPPLYEGGLKGVSVNTLAGD
jgi:hypothetical protein